MISTLAGAGCAGRSPRAVTPIAMEEIHLNARASGEGYEVEAIDAETLFREGLSRATAGDCASARAAYVRVADEFVSSRYASPSLYNAALCFHQLNRPDEAIPLYVRLVDGDVGDPRDVRHARFQLAELYAATSRYADEEATAERVLALDDLGVDERMEALARRAEALFGLGRNTEARTAAEEALRYYRTRPEDARPARDDFPALSTYVLAETFRVDAASVTIPPGDVSVQRASLERRAALILEAQRLYFDTIRFRIPTHAAAAGHRIGLLYDEFWQAITTAPIPPARDSASLAHPEQFEHEYRLAVARLAKPLIRHAIRYWEMTLMLVERYGADPALTARIHEDLERMRTRLSEQPEGPEGLPANARAASGGAGR